MNKMHLRGLLLIGLAVVGLPARGQINGPLNPERDFVASDKNAYLMLPPTVICGPVVKATTWSADGERLLILRDFTDVTPDEIRELLVSGPDKQAPPLTERQIISWNSVTRKTTTLYKLSEKEGRIEEAYWMAGSSSVIVLANFFPTDDQSHSHRELFLVNSSGATKSVAKINDRGGYQVDPSPYRPTAAFIEYPPEDPGPPPGTPPVERSTPPEPATVRFFSYDGALSQPFKFPAPHSILFWSNDGRAYSLTFQRDAKTKTSKRLWAFANTSTHKFEPCSAPADSGFGAPEPTQEISVVSLSAKASFKKLGINAPTVVAAATDETKENDPGIVTTDGRDPELSPKLNAVAFISQENLMVRTLVKVPVDAYRKAKDAALRTALLSRAKQAGLALLMYSGDYDDNFPSNKGNWASLLEPYAKNSAIFDGFNYTFPGGNATQIENPADTMLGYLDGPGGRAVVYSDGHAKWIPNP